MAKTRAARRKVRSRVGITKAVSLDTLVTPRYRSLSFFLCVALYMYIPRCPHGLMCFITPRITAQTMIFHRREVSKNSGLLMEEEREEDDNAGPVLASWRLRDFTQSTGL